jgi:hypothetical protein
MLFTTMSTAARTRYAILVAIERFHLNARPSHRRVRSSTKRKRGRVEIETLEKSPRRGTSDRGVYTPGRKRSRVASSYRMTVRRRNTVERRSSGIEIQAMALTWAGAPGEEERRHQSEGRLGRAAAPGRTRASHSAPRAGAIAGDSRRGSGPELVVHLVRPDGAGGNLAKYGVVNGEADVLEGESLDPGIAGDGTDRPTSTGI